MAYQVDLFPGILIYHLQLLMKNPENAGDRISALTPWLTLVPSDLRLCDDIPLVVLGQQTLTKRADTTLWL